MLSGAAERVGHRHAVGPQCQRTVGAGAGKGKGCTVQLSWAHERTSVCAVRQRNPHDGERPHDNLHFATMSLSSRHAPRSMRRAKVQRGSSPPAGTADPSRAPHRCAPRASQFVRIRLRESLHTTSGPHFQSVVLTRSGFPHCAAKPRDLHGMEPESGQLLACCKGQLQRAAAHAPHSGRSDPG